MEIDYIMGPKIDRIFGVSKYQMEIHRRLDVKLNVIDYTSFTRTFEIKYNKFLGSKPSSSPAKPKSKSPVSNKLFSFLVNTSKNIFTSVDRYQYQYLVGKKVKQGNVKHITSQEFAYLLNSMKPGKNIATCYDLIPWAYENNRSSAWKANITGLKKADRIITISKFSKSEIIKYLNYPEERIGIVYPAVDHEMYKPYDNKNILDKLDIKENQKIMLYVGSEDPRQNVEFLIKAFAKLKKELGEVKLIKIGNPHLYGAREKLLALIDELSLQKDVIFMNFVSEDELPEWYSAADLVVYPCSYAGFGMPPLEAMACGTPVITSNTTSLPEVVGNDGIMVDPHDINEVANKMLEVLKNEGLRDDMIKKGLKRGKMFNWDESAAKTLKIYEEMSIIL